MLLRVNGVRKSFGGLEVLRGVDLSVEKGDVVAILGPSGSGKTTLLRCMNFLERADGGVLTFDGEEFQLGQVSKKDVARLRKKTGFVFQSFNLFLNKTALQNVTEGLVTAWKMPRAEAEEIGRGALEKVGLADRMDYYPSQLSGGQQQRVAIGRALITRPKMILADEPTGNLDRKNSQDVIDLLTQASRRYQQTILMITHNNNLTAVADRVFRVSDGVLTDLGGGTNETLS